MIKTEIKMAPGVDHHEISGWLNKNFGSARPRGSDNKQLRRQWSMKTDFFHKKITVMCRRPEDAVAVRLRWL